jgi:hypothetical protein
MEAFFTRGRSFIVEAASSNSNNNNNNPPPSPRAAIDNFLYNRRRSTEENANLLFFSRDARIKKTLEPLCERLGLDPESLIPKSFESFKKSKDEPDSVVKLRFDHAEMRRKAKLEALRKMWAMEYNNNNNHNNNNNSNNNNVNSLNNTILSSKDASGYHHHYNSRNHRELNAKSVHRRSELLLFC